MQKFLVISLGGSLMYPDTHGLDIVFLKNFRDIILTCIQRTEQRFIFVTGGGKICREYNSAVRSLFSSVSDEELDWMGIKCTKVNAELLRIIFGDLAYFKVLDHPQKQYRTSKKILVSGGAKPGQSSDAVAVSLAKSHGADTVINLSNIDAVCDTDPKKNFNAKRISEISWKKYRKIIGEKWSPGANFPFDPIASRRAERYKMKVIVANGQDLKNFKKILNGEKFQGTIIS